MFWKVYTVGLSTVSMLMNKVLRHPLLESPVAYLKGYNKQSNDLYATKYYDTTQLKLNPFAQALTSVKRIPGPERVLPTGNLLKLTVEKNPQSTGPRDKYWLFPILDSNIKSERFAPLRYLINNKKYMISLSLEFPVQADYLTPKDFIEKNKGKSRGSTVWQPGWMESMEKLYVDRINELMKDIDTNIKEGSHGILLKDLGENEVQIDGLVVLIDKKFIFGDEIPSWDQLFLEFAKYPELTKTLINLADYKL